MKYPRAECGVEACDDPVVRGGKWCGKHHQRIKKYGDPHRRFGKTETKGTPADVGSAESSLA